ncbi:hypothetical protein ACFH22_05520 [Acinetobacter baumannii]|nr:hypothetical protein [Acinetobacter baumannii]ELZ5899469.1 hypothetical protein [Acinetobacter baumannii]EMD0933619.1 hypothetical protein [Acinetobacter baumannii]
MKPEQFIREYRVEKAREVVANQPKMNATQYRAKDKKYSSLFKPSPEIVYVADLKRLVESLKIINDLGGVEKLTPAFITTDKHVGYTHVRMVGNGRLSFLDDFCDFIPDGSISIKRVMTAIRDHESIYGGGESHAN